LCISSDILKILDDASSSLDASVERKDTINANHMMMCRFKGQDDDGYRKGVGVISGILLRIKKSEARRRKKLFKGAWFLPTLIALHCL